MENSRAEGREEQSRYQEQDEQSVCDEKEPTGFFSGTNQPRQLFAVQDEGSEVRRALGWP